AEDGIRDFHVTGVQTCALPISLSVGTNNPLFNIGKLENRGLDLLVGFNDQVLDFSYGISTNVSFLTNEVTRLYQGQPLSTGFGRVEVGRSEEHTSELQSRENLECRL